MEPYAGLSAARQTIDQTGILCIAPYCRILFFLDTSNDDFELMVRML